MTTRKFLFVQAFGLAMILAGPAAAQTEDIYVSASGSGTAGGIGFDDEDIVVCDRSGGPGTCIWDMFFDGSSEGVSRASDLAAFHVQDDDNILLSFKTPKRIGNLKKVDDSDVVHFDRTAPPNSAFSFFFDGSDVGLTTDDESIDAMGFDELGRLVVSTDGDYSVPQTGGGTLTGGDEDLIVFNGTIGSSITTGDWELFFDGSAVGLNSPQEDVWGVWIDDNTDEVYLTTRGDFTVGSLSGNGLDIFVCGPGNFNPISICAAISGFFSSGFEGLEDKIIDGIFIVNNSPPIAVDDSFTTDEDTLLNGGTNVLAANPTTPDSDPDGDPLTVTLVNGSGANVGVQIVLASGALLTVGADGSMTYDPNGQFESLGAGESDQDSFTYTIDDGNGGTDSATVTITITGVNDQPVLDPIGNQTVDEETALNFTATATDVENDTLTFSLAGAVPAGASITAGGDFTWTPTEAQGPGSFTFDVVVTDDGTPNLDDSETITVTVNEVNVAPVLDPIGNQTIDEETLLSFTATATDADLPPNTLTFSLAGAVPAGAGITAGGDFTWTPTEAQGPGMYTFDVVVTDDGAPNLSDSETITVTVDEVNVAPVLDPVGDQTVDEETLLAFTATATDADLPPNTLTFSLAGAVPAGASITAGGDFSWTPTEEQGPDTYTFDVVVTDDGTPNLDDSETITVTVDDINVAPVLDAIGDQTVDEETLLSFTATATDADLPPDTLTFSLAGAVPAGASITPGGDFTWTPTEAQGPGTFTFDVVVTDDGVPNLDDSETITVTVDEINVAPVLDPIGNQTVDEETLLSFTATASDADLPPNALTFSLSGVVPAGASITAGGLFSWTPTEAQGPGPYTFDVVVTDDGTPNLDDSETITVTVNEVNVAPVLDPIGNPAVNELSLLSFTATATDADIPANALTFSLAGVVPAGASITAGGGFSWTPTEAQGPGSYTFDVVVTDDGAPNLSDSETITVTVNEVNVAPVLDPVGNQVVDEGSLLSFTATATDVDLPPNVLTFSLAGAVPAGASITAGGLFTWTPSEPQGPGLYTFDVVVMDDGVPILADSETIMVTVNEVNNKPVAADQAYDATGNVRISVPAVSGLLVGSSDPDGDGVTVNGVSSVTAGAIVTFNPDGSFTYTPPAGFSGDDTFSYTLIDDGVGTLVSDPATVTVTVNDVIWFIDNTAGAPGDGRLATPFDSLAAFEAVNGSGGANDPEAGDDIFVYTGVGSYSGGVTLENNQQLIGQGTTDTSLADALGITLALFSDPLPSINGTRPELGPTGTAVVLASGNTVRGLDISVTGGSQGLVGSGFGTATINEIEITTETGTALSLNNGNATATFDSVTSTTAGGNSAIVLINTGAGAIAVNGGTISNKTVDAITLNDTDGPVTLANMVIEDIGDASDATDPFNTRSGQDGIHGQTVSGGLTLDGVTIRRISDMCVNGALFSDGVSPTTWNGLDILNSTIEDCNRWHVADTGDTTDEGAVRIVGLTGTVDVDNSMIQRAGELMDIFTTPTGTFDMTVTNSNFEDAFKEFTSGPVVAIGKVCIDVTVEGNSNANVTIGGAGTFPNNEFINCGTASVRVSKDTTPAGISDIEVIIDNNQFRVTDQTPANGVFGNTPQGGVALRAGPGGIGDFDTIVSNNTFGVAVGPDDDIGSTTDEVANADGVEGNLALIFESGDAQARVNDNTFNGSINAPWFNRGDGNTSAAVLYRDNSYRGRSDYCCDAGFTFRVPGIPYRTRVRNNGNLDITFENDQFAVHDQFFFANTENLEFESPNVGGGGTLCVALDNVTSPDGFEFDEDAGIIELYQGAVNNAATGPCGVEADGHPVSDCELEVADDGVRGGPAGHAQSGAPTPALNPPHIDVDGGSIAITGAACAVPTGGIF